MNRKLNFALLAIGIMALNNSFAQEHNTIHLTTGVGVNKIQGVLGNTFKSTLAFNSGFEKAFSKNQYAQIEVNFNSLKYDQQVKDANSPFLFQNTNSSFLMIGINWGRDFRFGKSPWFSSLYGGSGYLNIGEPRIIVDEVNNIVKQKAIRKGGVLGKGGGRIGVNTKSGLFQTLYVDGSWFTSTLKTQGEIFRSVSVFIGMRMAMNNENKLIKRPMKTLRKGK